MLFGQQLGGRHQRGLTAVLDGAQTSQCSDDGLAAAHIALQQALHRLRPGQVRFNGLPGALLRTGKRERQGSAQRCHQTIGRRRRQ